MFKKLLKYEVRAISKLWWIGVLISVFGSVIASLLIRFNQSVSSNEEADPFLSLLAIFGGIVAIFCILAVILSFVFTMVLVFVRFYKHFFTDEGYLTFTLPVKRSALLFSKTVNAAIWFCAHLAVIGISLLIFAVLVSPTDKGDFFISFEIFEQIGKLFEQLWDGVGAWLILYTIEGLLILFAYLMFWILLVYFCITFGAVLVKKKAKIIAAIGIYYAFSSALTAAGQFSFLILVGLVSNGVSILTQDATQNQIFAMYAALALVILAVIAAIASVLYSVTQYMLDRKLNLA